MRMSSVGAGCVFDACSTVLCWRPVSLLGRDVQPLAEDSVELSQVAEEVDARYGAKGVGHCLIVIVTG